MLENGCFGKINGLFGKIMANNIVIMSGLDRNKSPIFKNNCGRTLSKHAVMYIVRGSGYFEDEITARTAVKAGTVFFLYPGRWHNFDPAPGSVWTEYWALFDGFAVEKLFGKIIPSESPLFFYGISSSLKQAYESLYAEKRQRDPWVYERSLYLIHSILMQIFLKANMKRAGTVNEFVAEAENAVEYAVEKNMPFDFKEFAENAGIGYEKFRKDFFRQTGASPVNYMTMLKIEKAMEFLSSPAMTIKEISSILGYQDPYYFSRLFKSRKNVSPENFRKNLFCKRVN